MEKKTEYQKVVVTGMNILTAELLLLLKNNPKVGEVQNTVIDYMNDLYNEMCKNFCCDGEDET